MVQQIAEMPVAETMVTRTRAQRGWNPRQWAAIFGVIEAVVAVALIAGVVIHHHGASRPSAPVVSPTLTSQQARFLENNTTNLPNAVTADSRPVVATSAQQRFLEVNTTMLPNSIAADGAAPVISAGQQRFLDENTTWLPVGTSPPYMEEVTPTISHPR